MRVMPDEDISAFWEGFDSLSIDAPPPPRFRTPKDDVRNISRDWRNVQRDFKRAVRKAVGSERAVK